MEKKRLLVKRRLGVLGQSCKGFDDKPPRPRVVFMQKQGANRDAGPVMAATYLFRGREIRNLQRTMGIPGMISFFGVWGEQTKRGTHTTTGVSRWKMEKLGKTKNNNHRTSHIFRLKISVKLKKLSQEVYSHMVCWGVRTEARVSLLL